MEHRFGVRGLPFIERNKLVPAAALHRLLAITRIGEEMLKGGDEEGTNFSLRPLGVFVDFAFDEVSEESLRQVLRVGARVTAKPRIGIERRPVGLAKLSQRCSRDFRIGLTPGGGQHQAPLCRQEWIGLSVNRSRQELHALL